MAGYFKIRGELSKRRKMTYEVIGIIFFLSLWEALPRFGLVSEHILPGPIAIMMSFKELWFKDALARNILYSLVLNTCGAMIAIVISLPLGYLIGLFPEFRAIFQRPVIAMRYLPITALIGLFILWFGIGREMKVLFLAFGIILYLLPTVVQRVDSVDQVYVDTVRTLGARKWQTFRRVFLPGALADIFADTGVLVALSWTYIIVVEVVNKEDGGVGALIDTARRQSRVDKSFAILFAIVLLGFVQDKIFTSGHKFFFRHKHQGGAK